MFLFHAIPHQLCDVDIPLIGDDGFRIVVQFLLTVPDMCVQMLHQTFIQLQLLQCLAVPLKNFDCIPAEIDWINLVLNGFLDMSNGMLDASREDVRQLLLLPLHGRFHAQLHRIIDGFSPQRGDLHHSASQCPAKFFGVDLIAVFPDEVHHVDRDDNRAPDLHKLCRQIQVALNIGAIHNIENDIRLVVNQVIPGNYLLKCVGAEGIDARQILNDDILVFLVSPLFLFHCHARPVADILIASRQRIEQCGLAAVRISRKCYLHFHGFCFLCPFCLIKTCKTEHPGFALQFRDSVPGIPLPAYSISRISASSLRRDSSYPRTVTSTGSPSGATLRT